MSHKKSRIKGGWTPCFLISSRDEPTSEEVLLMRGCGEQDAVLARSHQGHDKMSWLWNTAQRVLLICFPDSLFLNQSILDMFQSFSLLPLVHPHIFSFL